MRITGGQLMVQWVIFPRPSTQPLLTSERGLRWVAVAELQLSYLFMEFCRGLRFTLKLHIANDRASLLP